MSRFLKWYSRPQVQIIYNLLAVLLNFWIASIATTRASMLFSLLCGGVCLYYLLWWVQFAYQQSGAKKN